MSDNADDLARVDYEGADILIHATSRPERDWRVRSCAREPWTVAWLEAHVRPGDVVYDIGANVGVYSLIAASLLGGSGVVVAFEPAFASYAHLCKNAVLNGFDQTIIPVPLLLSATTSVQTLDHRSLEPGQSRHRHDAAEWTPDRRVKAKRYAQPIISFKLDDLVGACRLAPPTLVKIDVDGGEVGVIQGAGNVLGGDSVRSLLIEIESGLWDDVEGELSALGFELRGKFAGYGDANEYAEFVKAVSRGPMATETPAGAKQESDDQRRPGSLLRRLKRPPAKM